MRKRRAYQEQAFWANKRLRRYMLAWLRQGGKSTTLSEQSLLEMAEHPGRLITFATASLTLGGEMPEKEAQLWSAFLRDMRGWAEERKLQLVAGERRHVADDNSWRELPADIDIAALADVLDHSKFEVRLRHSNTVSSRLKVIAANVQTARGFTGSVKLDEAPFVPDLRTLMAEMEPIFSTDPTFCFLMAGTPPPDYAHYAYELFTPDDGREDWPVDPKGHWFQNRAGIWVHRVTIDDAFAAGRKNYHPDTGEEITPDQARDASPDKEGWDRSNRLKRPTVGSSAISPMALHEAQTKGKDRCWSGQWSAADMQELVHQLRFVSGTVTLGLDLATTENKTSNPSSLAIHRKDGTEHSFPWVSWWKSADPEVTLRRVGDVLMALRDKGVRLAGLSIDASNEVFYARQIRSTWGHLCPIHLRKGGEVVPGMVGADGLQINVKQRKGQLLADAAESGRLVLPFDAYLYKDFMRVVKDRGSFTATVGSMGEHGDVFDACAHALLEAMSNHGEAFAIYPTAANDKRPSWQRNTPPPQTLTHA